MDTRREPVFPAEGVRLPPDAVAYESGRDARKRSAVWIVVVMSVLILAGGFWAWFHFGASTARSSAEANAAGGRAEAPRNAEPPIKFPITSSAADDPEGLPGAGKVDAYIADSLGRLLGRDVVTSLFNLTDFVRRIVVTVDNLGREHAAASLWPIRPTPGRFVVRGAIGAQSVDPDNALRYLPFVRMFETADLNTGMALYVRLYPLFQKAYEDLGYPGRYFNDRLVEVIDHLLAAPEPSGAIAIGITEVKGPIKPARPWLNYEFADAELQRLSAGQKLLVRMGVDNERRVKLKLAAIRKVITSKGVAR